MPIETIGACVELAVDEPLRVGSVPFEGRRPRPDPLELFRKAGPERFRIVLCLGVDGGIVDERARSKFFGGSEAAIFLQQRFDLRRNLLGHPSEYIPAVAL